MTKMIVINNRTVLAALCLLAVVGRRVGVFGAAAVAVGSEEHDIEEPIAKTSNLRSGKRDLTVLSQNNFHLIRSDKDPRYCMDLGDFKVRDTRRQKVLLKKCNPNSWSQQWEHDNLGRLKLRLGRREMCMEAGNRGAMQFKDMFVWPCNHGEHQRWSHKKGSIFVNIKHEHLRIGTGRCHIGNGAHVQLRGESSCGNAEKFSVVKPGTVDLQPGNIGIKKPIEGMILKTDAFQTGEVFTVTAKSDDIWGRRDAFFFASLNLQKTPSNTLSIEVKIPSGFASTTNLHPWAKAGLMVRDTLDPKAKHFSALITGRKGPWAMYRETTDTVTHKLNEEGARSVPGECWLRIDRDGNQFSAYYRTEEPANIKAKPKYTLLGEATIEMGDSVELGIAVSSHDIKQFVSLDFAVTRFAVE